MRGTYEIEIEDGVSLEVEYTYDPGARSNDYDVPDDAPELYIENIILITDRRRVGIDLENVQEHMNKESVHEEIWKHIHE